MTDAPLPALQWQNALIARIVTQTARVKSFFLDMPAPFAFRAGQHVAVRLTADNGYSAQRNYSIASAPESPERLELAIERLDDGEVSPFFHDVAAVGDEIELRGPIGGHFVWTAAQGGPVLLIGGGSGVVPLMAMIRHRARQKSPIPMALLYSARTYEDIVFREELLALAQNGLSLTFALTRDAARRPGDFARRVDTGMLAEVVARLGGQPRQVFVCGSNGFVEAATRAALAGGIAREAIFTERFGT